MSKVSDFPGPNYTSRDAHYARRASVPKSNAEVVAEVEDEEAEFPKHTGGGWYELSDGSKVQGQEAAEEAEAKL